MEELLQRQRYDFEALQGSVGQFSCATLISVFLLIFPDSFISERAQLAHTKIAKASKCTDRGQVNHVEEARNYTPASSILQHCPTHER